MTEKAKSSDFMGRFREIISDPLNLLIPRHVDAGTVKDGLVTLHNGHRVPLRGEGAYYDSFSDILIINRGVHEPLEEYAFQQVLPHLPANPTMLELGAYWAHYSMWLKQKRPHATIHLVEPDPLRLQAGKENFERHGYEGAFIQESVGREGLRVDDWLRKNKIEYLHVLHSDIQGAEMEMLDMSQETLAEGRVGYAFISTHSQELHEKVRNRLASFGYRIEISSDFDNDTTSFDGFVLAVHPDNPIICPPPAPLGRTLIEGATPLMLVQSLRARVET